jgi:hypothetical protein
MEIVSFVYCDDVIENNSNHSSTIIAPMQMFLPVGLPSNYSFSISFGLYGLNKLGNDEIEISFLDPNKQCIAENKMIVPSLPDPIKQSKQPVGAQINIGFRNVVLNYEGKHYTVIKVNGEKLGEYPIHVNLRK